MMPCTMALLVLRVPGRHRWRCRELTCSTTYANFLPRPELKADPSQGIRGFPAVLELHPTELQMAPLGPCI